MCTYVLVVLSIAAANSSNGVGAVTVASAVAVLVGHAAAVGEAGTGVRLGACIHRRTGQRRW